MSHLEKKKVFIDVCSRADIKQEGLDSDVLQVCLCYRICIISRTYIVHILLARGRRQHYILPCPLRSYLDVLIRQRGLWWWNRDSFNVSNPDSCPPLFCFSGLMEIRSVSVGVVAIKSVSTGLYLAMSKRGTLFGSVRIQLYDIVSWSQYFKFWPKGVWDK